jgi:hypothetical protein
MKVGEGVVKEIVEVLILHLCWNNGEGCTESECEEEMLGEVLGVLWFGTLSERNVAVFFLVILLAIIALNFSKLFITSFKMIEIYNLFASLVSLATRFKRSMPHLTHLHLSLSFPCIFLFSVNYLLLSLQSCVKQ